MFNKERMENIEFQISDARKKPLKTGGKIFRSSEDFEVTEDELAKAGEELNETEEKKVEDLRKFKEMLEEHKDMRYRTDDEFLLRYLRHCKFDFNKAYSMICYFYSTRMKRPEIFSIPDNLESLVNREIINYLPYRDEHGRNVHWTNYSNWKLEETTFLELVQLSQIVIDIATMSPASQINGVVCIWDLEGLSARHLGQMFYPSSLKIFTDIIQVMYPVRIKLILLVNGSTLCKTVYNVAKHLVKKKFVERVKFIGSDWTELHQYLNPEILPKKYGGMLDDSKCSIAEHVLNNLQFLKSVRPNVKTESTTH